ncbi:MAG: Flp family type IVb pilin [Pirellulales bacterium]
MNKLFAGVKSFVREEDAPTMVEYGLMVALIAVACITAATLLGGSISALFGDVGTSISNVNVP